MDDLISRQAAIDAVRHSPIIEVQPAYMLIDKADVLKNLVMLPSAQRTGRWIWSDEEWGYRCSACRVKFDYDKTYELFDHGFMLANYCPYCGARMEGAEE